MNATIVAVDLAKNIFELAVADADWHIVQRQRLTRTKFLGFSAHYWARRISHLGHTVRLLPAHYVKAYVRRNKTDQADAAALTCRTLSRPFAPLGARLRTPARSQQSDRRARQ